MKVGLASSRQPDCHDWLAIERRFFVPYCSAGVAFKPKVALRSERVKDSQSPTNDLNTHVGKDRAILPRLAGERVL